MATNAQNAEWQRQWRERQPPGYWKKYQGKRTHYMKKYRKEILGMEPKRTFKDDNERREFTLKRNKLLNRAKKQAIIDAYGGKCQCCGESTFEFLTIDHTENDGKSHRAVIGKGQLYTWLIRMGFPKEGFQLLCMNCNFAKARYGRCPHGS